LPRNCANCRGASTPQAREPNRAKIAERQAEIAERKVEASMLHLEAARKGVG
jgi:hypothetical protein